MKQESFSDIDRDILLKKVDSHESAHGIAVINGVFHALNRCLEQAGRMMRGGTIVDATLISAPSSTKNAERGSAVRLEIPIRPTG